MLRDEYLWWFVLFVLENAMQRMNASEIKRKTPNQRVLSRIRSSVESVGMTGTRLEVPGK